MLETDQSLILWRSQTKGTFKTKKTPRRLRGDFVHGVPLTNHTLHMEYVFFMPGQSDIPRVPKSISLWNLSRYTCP